MAKKISELPLAGAVADADELELNQAGTSRKATRAQIVAGLAAAAHVHTLADVTDAGALAAKDVVAEADLQDAAVTTAKLADLSVSTAKLALQGVSSDRLADGAVTNTKIADGAVTTAKIGGGAVGATQLADNAVIAAKIASGAVTTAKIGGGAVGATQLADNAVIAAKIAGGAVIAAKIAAGAVGATQLADNGVTTAKLADNGVTAGKIASKAIGPAQLADTSVTPGVFTLATITVDQQGRITAAASGTAGEANTGANVGSDGVGVFAGKVGTELQFRHVTPASDRISVTLDGQNIDIDVVEGNLQIAAGNVTGLAAVATIGSLAALTSLDAGGGALTNHRAAQDSLSGNHTFVQTDSGREKVFTGVAPATWTIPALSAGTHAVVHNMGTAPISFVASGVTLKGLTTLPAEKTAAVSWLPGNVVKLTGELS
jgi:hypothetical protein